MLREAAVFVWMEEQRIRGFIATHVDDFLWAGVGDFENTVINPLRARFPIGEEIFCVGTRFETRLDWDGNLLEIVMDQTEYVDEIIPGEVDGSLKDDQLLDKKGHREYQGMVGSLLWAAGMTRPDIAFDVASVSGATNAPTIADAKRVLKVIKKTKRTEVHLRFPRITGPVVMIAYCDAAWGNLSDSKTGGGLFVCLVAANP